MSRSAFLIACAVLAKAADERRVRFYIAATRTEQNAKFVHEYAGSMTGVYACCNLIRVDAQGNVTTHLDVTANAAPFLDRGLTYHAMVTPNQSGILSGNAKRGALDVIRIARAANITGVIFDYEPSTEYGWEHEYAYMDFLRAVKREAAPSLEVGMNVAGWGILKNLSAYTPASLDLHTSMTPTYFQKEALAPEGRAFVRSLLDTFGAEKVATGVGSMPASGYEQNCAAHMPDYGWNSSGFDDFVDGVAAQGVMGVDVWRCDIDDYGKSPSWLYSKLAAFLAGQISLI